MLQLSKIMLIFVPSFGKRRRHRGERLSFDPPENLQNSKYKGEKSESCFSCSSIYTAHSLVESAHIYTCRCEPISFLLIRVLQNLLAKDVKKAHTLLYQTNIMRDNYQTDIERLRNSIETAIDRQILTPKDYEYLATCIFNKLHQTVSISTLKRLWGYVPSSTMPRESTLDLLAQFLDYDSWSAFRKDEKTLPVSEMPEAAKKPKPLKTYAITIIAVLMAVVALAFMFLSRWSPLTATTEQQSDSTTIIRIGQRYDSPQQYLRLFGIIADKYLWGQQVPHHPNISVWGPKYHHPEWHNDGDSAKMLPTITEWWESPDSSDSVVAAIRNSDRYLQYRRMDELRITFMKDLVDTGYVFLGVYRLSLSQSDTTRCIWQRVADEVDLHDIDKLEKLRQ